MGELTLISSPIEYFKDQVRDACLSINANLSNDLEYYVVNLLTNYVKPPDFDEVMSTPLAIQLKIALESSHADRFKLLKGLGDFSLYAAGFFQDYLSSRTIGIDYYISMGSSAYLRISETVPDTNFAEIYRQLCDDFTKLVEVIATVSDMQAQSLDHNLVNMYEKWLKTGSLRIKKSLEEKGIQLSTHPDRRHKQ